MTDRFEYKRFQLKCISPIHIGSGVTLRALEYLFDNRKGEVYFVDESKFSHYLLKMGLLDEFTDDMQRMRVVNLWDWLLSKKCKPGDIERLRIRKAQAYGGFVINKRKNTLNDIAVLATLADGRPYIPGSSIKGAFRTAILCRLLKKHPELQNKLWMFFQNALKFNQKPNDIKKAINKEMDNVEHQLLSVLKLYKDKNMTQLCDNALRDALKGLSVSDAMPVDRSLSTIILQKTDASLKDGRVDEHGISLFRECIPPGAKFSFSVTMDKGLLKLIGISSIDEIVKDAHDFYSEGLKIQEAVFGRNYSAEFDEAKDMDLMLGGGTGFISKTLFYAVAPSVKEGTRVLAKYFDIVFQQKRQPAHKHVQMDKMLTPRTLKLTRTDRERCIMGMCSLEE